MSTAQPQSDQSSVVTIVNAIAATIEDGLSPGDVAALRRLRPVDPSCAAFWRVAAIYLSDALSGSRIVRREAERRWAVILQSMAEMKGMHRPGARLGRALAEAEIHERRVLKLLRASGDALFDAVRVTAHHLANTATPADQLDIARLVLSDKCDDEEDVRLQIAREYYWQQERKRRDKEVAHE